jgi:TM2 domain-containing membrane protein YozV
MKRAIISPLCSAFIIPGLGQILNRNIKKGMILLALVFLFFVAAIIKLTFMILSLLEGQRAVPTDSMIILEKLHEQDSSALLFILIGFGIIWLYSVIDAVLEGIKNDRMEGEDSP